MPTVRRSLVLEAPPEHVFALVADAEHMPRWWPGVRRMEGVGAGRFTQVHTTSKGKAVRQDFEIIESQAPAGGAPGVHSFAQEVLGTPFERVLVASSVEVRVAAEGDGAEVTIAQRMTLRGMSKLGGFMLRRATRARLDEALANLARIA